MEYFVNIKSVFNKKNDRTIEVLKEIYEQRDSLIKFISSVISDKLTEKTIKGKKILLKPNWVKHDLKPSDKICLRTHDNFLLAALEVILKLKPKSILIGDAPIQGCNWDKMVTADFISKVDSLSEKYNIPIKIKDFRRMTFDPLNNKLEVERNPLSDYIIFDLGEKSYLEPITAKEKQLFRVTDYDPDRFKESHAPGVHKYCITKELFNADLIISLPKVKTHQKAGITAALKNIVGLNGDKDFLPHHRVGGTGFGGDCYPGKNYLRYGAELVLDEANKRRGQTSYKFLKKFSSLLWKLSFPGKGINLGAGWHGNDTTWRMVLDLNKIIIYGKSDGAISDTPMRQLFSLCDGIIGGQGDGPLKPDPLLFGIISFTNHSAMNDLTMGTLMGFNIEKIPLLKTAAKSTAKQNINLFWNNKKCNLEDLKKFAVKTQPPPGWTNYLI